MSKVDPEKLNKLDRRSTLLLRASRSQTGTVDEKNGQSLEEPGMDTLRGSFGAVGSIIRARTLRRLSQNSQNTTHVRMRPTGAAAPHDPTVSMTNVNQLTANADLPRHQLYDPPVPRDDTSSIRDSVLSQPISAKRPTIKFDSQDVVHSYKRPGTGDNTATHEHRQAQGSILYDGYPPLSTIPGSEEELDTNPTMSRNATTPQVIPKLPPPHQGQLVNVPPLIANEHTVHSAPPTIRERYTRIAAPQPTRVDVKDLFDSNSARETLLSFPSVTDSAPSEWGGADVEKESRHMKEKEKPRERVKSPKRYPRSSVNDDEEESEILFRKATISSEGADSRSDTPPPDVSGIRLVSVNQREYL